MSNISLISEQQDKVLSFLQDMANLKSEKRYDEADELILKHLNAMSGRKQKVITPEGFKDSVNELKSSPEKMYLLFFLVSEKIMLCLLAKHNFCINQLVISLKEITESLEPRKNEDSSFMINRSLLEMARAIPPEIWNVDSFECFIETLNEACLFKDVEKIIQNRRVSNIKQKWNIGLKQLYTNLMGY